MLYPLKFHPIYKEKIWGGEKLKTFLNKDFSPLANCGESWEISGVPGNISVVKEGFLKGEDLKSLISKYKGDFIGKRVYHKYKNEFPLLIKFIDAREDLSIQVHPNDKLAKSRHNSFGKTEMWYILQADPKASLISGFNRPVNKAMYLDYFNRGRLMDLLNQIEVRKEDSFFIPAGRVHTIGKGLLLAEIQQSSDVTYRIYDFDRVDLQGNKRDLHIEEALDAIDYQYYDHYRTDYSEKINNAVELASCKYFTTNKLAIKGKVERSYLDLDSFVVLICVEGNGMIKYDQTDISLAIGEVIMIPSGLKRISIESDSPVKMLETYVSPDRR